MARNLHPVRNGFEPHSRMAPCQIFTLPNTRRERALQSACHCGNQSVTGVSLLVEPVREKTISAASGKRRPAGKGRAVIFIEVECHRRCIRQETSKRYHVAAADMDEIVASLTRNFPDVLRHAGR